MCYAIRNFRWLAPEVFRFANQQVFVMPCWCPVSMRSKDSGWPGHRLVSLLLYLRAPDAGGETCLLQLGDGTLNPGIKKTNPLGVLGISIKKECKADKE